MIYVQMDRIEEPRGTFYLTVVSCITYFTSYQKITKIAGMTTLKKLVNLSGSFEDTAKFNWQPMELFADVYFLQFVTIPASVFGMYYSLCMLKLDRLLKRELQ